MKILNKNCEYENMFINKQYSEIINKYQYETLIV
jgi:hypothetical protein